jgi:DNA-binding winged helix-turn-helix (wHTH) protein
MGPNESIRFGSFVFEWSKGLLREASTGAKVKVPGKESALLKLLVENNGVCITYQRIAEKLWPNHWLNKKEHTKDWQEKTPEVNALIHHIQSRKSRLITRIPRLGSYLHEVHGKGYYFEDPDAPAGSAANLEQRSERRAIQANIIDRTALIEQSTAGFVGRGFLLRQIDEFMQQKHQGYIFVRGDPGIGKTAFAAQLVRTQAAELVRTRPICIHHFNVRREGLSGNGKFLMNICAQLITRFDLPYTSLPKDTDSDAQRLNSMLNEAAQRANSKLLIIVDALDEVEMLTDKERLANPLYLPTALPSGVYFLVTMRRMATPFVACDQLPIDIEANGQQNLGDIRKYLEIKVSLPEINRYLVENGETATAMIDSLTTSSEGNFMYLRHVVPELAGGIYKDRKLRELPKGLQDYYADHWSIIKKKTPIEWERYTLPVILALAVSPTPVPASKIAQSSGVSEDWRIVEVLEQWSQFVLPQSVNLKGRTIVTYRLYHESFREFLDAMNKMPSKGVDLQSARKRMIRGLGYDVS